MRRVVFDPEGPDAFARLRTLMQRLLASGIAPEELQFVDEGAPEDLFAQTLDVEALPAGAALGLPRDIARLIRRVCHHRDPERLGLIHRALFRSRARADLFRDAIDPDVRALQRLDQAVRRDAHKTKAFVRFRQVDAGAPHERFIAWHGAEHRVLPLVAPFFARRFSSMRFSILTADAAVHHDDGKLTWAPGVPRRDAPEADALDALWRDYYGAIFDPARVRLSAMKAEMPVKHWRTLPETQDMGALLADAPRRVRDMRERIAEMPSAEKSIPPRASLPQLAAALPSCRACDLHGPATQVVPGVGPSDAAVALVGEQPGDAEDLAGVPFVGPAGQLLREAMRDVGLDPDACFLTNAVKHFRFREVSKEDEPGAHPRHRGKKRIHDRARAGEVRACAPWLRAELGALRPRVVVLLGQTATRALLGGHVVAKKHRGELMQTPFADAALITWHPAAALRARDAATRARIEAELREHLALAKARAIAPSAQAVGG